MGSNDCAVGFSLLGPGTHLWSASAWRFEHLTLVGILESVHREILCPVASVRTAVQRSKSLYEWSTAERNSVGELAEGHRSLYLTPAWKEYGHRMEEAQGDEQCKPICSCG